MPARLFEWAMSLWLTAMAAWYVWIAIGAVGHPLNVGTDRWWAVICLLFAAAGAACHTMMPRPAAARVWAAAVLAVATAMFVASARVPAALIALWVLALAWSLGERSLQWLRAAPSGTPFERPGIAVTLGLAFLALLGLGLGLARILTPAAVWIALIALTALERRSLLETVRRARRIAAEPNLGFEESLVLSLSSFVLLLDLAWALAPEINYDALNYHLAVGKIFLGEHRVLDLPYFWHSYFVQLADMLYTLALALGGQTVAKLLVLAMTVAAAGLVYGLGSAFFSPRVGLWAAALFFSTPMTAWLSTTAYVDLPVALCLAASLLAFLRWRESLQAGWLWASGLAAGAAIGVKATAVWGLPVLAAVLIVDLIRRRGPVRGARWKALAGFLAAGALLALPWYVVRWAFTGNPFFPLFNRFFPAARLIPVNFAASGIVGGGYGHDRTLLGLLKVPFLLTFATNRFWEPFPPGALGIALVVWLPLGLALAWSRRKQVLVILAVCAVFLGLWTTSGNIRYYFPVLPVLTVLAVAAVESASASLRRRRFHFGLLLVVLAAEAAVIPVQFWNIPDRIPWRSALGLESPEKFLSRALPPYDAVRYLNRVVLPGQKVVSIGADNLRFYLDAPLLSAAETFELRHWMEDSREAGLARTLAAHGCAYLLRNRLDTRKRGKYEIDQSFYDHFTTLEFSRHGSLVYRLSPGGSQRTAGVNLLANPGFEARDADGEPAAWAAVGNEGAGAARAAAHSGAFAVLATETRSLTQRVKVAAGRLYTLGHFTRADREGQFARLQINWQNERGALEDASIEVVPAGPVWTWRQMTVTAPDRAAVAVIYASAHGASRVWFDDIWFGPGMPPEAP